MPNIQLIVIEPTSVYDGYYYNYIHLIFEVDPLAKDVVSPVFTREETKAHRGTIMGP